MELIAPVEDEGAFRRAMEPCVQDEEDRVPVDGEEVRPEDLQRTLDVREVRDEGSPVMRAPVQPSEEENQEHFPRQSAPYADWCEACFAGHGRGIQHRKNKDEKEEVVIQFDYQIWSEDSTEKSNGEPGLATSLTVVEISTGAVRSTVVPHKGRWKYTEIGVAKGLKSPGHTCSILQSDSDYPKQSVGAAGVSSSIVGSRVRASLHHIKMQTGEVTTPGNYLFVGANRHATWAYNRLAKSSDGSTSYRALHGVNYVPPIVAFGERLLYTEPKLGSLQQTAPRWGTGARVGRSAGSDDHMLLMVHSAMSGRTIKRLPCERRWGARELRRARGLPRSVREGVDEERVEESAKQFYFTVPVEKETDKNDSDDVPKDSSPKLRSSSSTSPDRMGAGDDEDFEEATSIPGTPSSAQAESRKPQEEPPWESEGF